MNDIVENRAHCPVCGLAVETEAVQCELCGTPHHKECWEYNFGCAVFACRENWNRLGRCTLCGRKLDDASAGEIRTEPRLPPSIVPGVSAGIPARSSFLCRECVESSILAGGGMPSRTAVVLSMAFVVVLLTFFSLLLAALMTFFMVLAVASLGSEMKRNAECLPGRPRLGSPGGRALPMKGDGDPGGD